GSGSKRSWSDARDAPSLAAVHPYTPCTLFRPERIQKGIPMQKIERVRRGKQRGQGMTEYIIIVALIAVAAIGTFKFFGETIRNQVAGLAAEVSGQSGAD